MNNLLSKSLFRIISIVLIQAFLILDIAWAGGTELSVIKPTEMLSPSVQISQQVLTDSFNDLYDLKDLNTAVDITKIKEMSSPEQMVEQKESKWTNRWQRVKDWASETIKLMAQSYKSDKKDNDNDLFSGLKSILLPAFLTTAIIALSSKFSWAAEKASDFVTFQLSGFFSTENVFMALGLFVFFMTLRALARKFFPKIYHQVRIKELEKRLGKINIPTEIYHELQGQLRKAMTDASRNLVDSGNGYNPLAIILKKIDNLEKASKIKTEILEHRQALKLLSQKDSGFSKDNDAGVIKPIDNVLADSDKPLVSFMNAQDSTFNELNADVLLLCGNDDIGTFKETLKLYKTGKVKKIILTGGIGRLTVPLLETARDLGFEIRTEDNTPVDLTGDLNAVILPEAEITYQIMQSLAKQMDLELDRNDFYFETKSTNTPENFKFAKDYIKQIKKDLKKEKLTVAYMQVPHQQFRTKATFNRFKEEWKKRGVTGISYTTAWDTSKLTEDQKVEMIASELWRVVIYSAKGDLVPLYGNDQGIDAIPDKYWKEITQLIFKAKPEVKEKIRQSLMKLSLGVNDEGKYIVATEKELRDLLEQKGAVSSVYLDSLINFVYEPKHITISVDDSITFAMIKPDGYQMQDKILEMIKDAGFEVVAMQPKVFSIEDIKKFYEVHKDRPFFSGLVDYINSGPVIQLVLKHEGDKPAYAVLRDLLGEQDGSTKDSWRQLLGVEKIDREDGTYVTQNKIHGSDSIESVIKEIGAMKNVKIVLNADIKITDKTADVLKADLNLNSGLTLVGQAI